MHSTPKIRSVRVSTYLPAQVPPLRLAAQPEGAGAGARLLEGQELIPRRAALLGAEPVRPGAPAYRHTENQSTERREYIPGGGTNRPRGESIHPKGGPIDRRREYIPGGGTNRPRGESIYLPPGGKCGQGRRARRVLPALHNRHTSAPPSVTRVTQ
eukprot:1182743-Prorocentrum_minimum.AAC.1